MPDTYRSFGFNLFPLQAKAYQKLMYRVGDGRPSLFWAGMQAGKTAVCSELSRALEAMPQIGIGFGAEAFERYYFTEYEYVHPVELPLDVGRERDLKWEIITPYTLVFIDDFFNIPDAEMLYARLLCITPHIIAMGQVGDSKFPIGRYVHQLIGPYSSWEMNPLLDADVMRRERDKLHLALTDRTKFNNDLVACVDVDNWKHWSAT